MTVKIYTTPSCPYCQMAKSFFREKGVEFQEINVAEDRESLLEMVEKSGQMGVPVIEIDGEIVVGFDLPRLTELLAEVSKIND